MERGEKHNDGAVEWMKNNESAVKWMKIAIQMRRGEYTKMNVVLKCISDG